MENAQIIITFILKVAGFIAAIGLAWTYIKKWNTESKCTRNSELIQELKAKVEKNDERLTRLENVNRRQDKFVEAMCSSMLALLDHNINGDSIDKLKEAKAEMQEFLIHRC